MNSLQKCLKKILYESNDTFLVIDALNKCTQQEKLLNLIMKICSWKLLNLKILTTSQSEQNIKVILSTLFTCISIQSVKINSDIQLYIDKHLNSDFKLRKWSINAVLTKEIQMTLINKADKM